MGSTVRLGVEVQQGGGRYPRVLGAVLGLERLEGIAASPTLLYLAERIGCRALLGQQPARVWRSVWWCSDGRQMTCGQKSKRRFDFLAVRQRCVVDRAAAGQPVEPVVSGLRSAR